MSVRIYVPSTLSALRELVVSGGVGPGRFPAHAVTDSLCSELADGGEEEWEYAAMSEAGHDSIGLLAEDDVPRRVVLVFDADSVTPVEGATPSQVEVDGVLPLAAIAAVHMDSVEAETQIARARAAWREAANGDVGSRAVVEGCFDYELGWYAPQEIDALIG